MKAAVVKLVAWRFAQNDLTAKGTYSWVARRST